MALTERIETLLVGNATGLINTFKEGGTAADAFAAKTTTTGRLMERLGLQGLSTGDAISKGLGLGAAAGGIALGAFALKGVQTFADLTSTVRGFQRITGATAEDSSRLAAATQRMGIDAQTAQTAFGQLSKRIGEQKDTLAQWGVTIAHNKDGSVDFAATLANISDKYSSLTDATQRQAFATENFGKGAQSINALLGQGKTNLEQFYSVAEAQHHIFSQDDLNKGLEFSRSLKDLQTEIQGVQLELGSALLPAVKTLADVSHVAVAGLDSLGGSMSSAAVIGGGFAAVGAKIRGSWGAVAGVTIGLLIQGFEDFANQGLESTHVVEDFGAALSRLTAKEAAKDFEDITAKLSQFGVTADGAKGKFELFQKIADGDITGAQKIVQGMKALGESTAGYDKILGGAIQHQKDAKAATDAASTATGLNTSATDQSTGAIKANDQAVKDYLKSLGDEAKALQQVQSLLLQSQGGEVGRQQAVIAAAQAQDAFNQAVADYGPDSTQARDASLALQQARLQETQSTLDAKKSQDDLTDAVKNHPAAVQQEIDALQASINKYGDADGAIQAQIDKLHAYQYVIGATQPQVVTNVFVEGIDQAAADLRALEADLVRITQEPWFVNVAIAGNAAGPHTG